MQLIDVKQNHKITLIIGALAALGGVTAFLVYLENKNNRSIQNEILSLDKEIKELQLYRLKNNLPA